MKQVRDRPAACAGRQLQLVMELQKGQAAKRGQGSHDEESNAEADGATVRPGIRSQEMEKTKEEEGGDYDDPNRDMR